MSDYEALSSSSAGHFNVILSNQEELRAELDRQLMSLANRTQPNVVKHLDADDLKASIKLESLAARYNRASSIPYKKVIRSCASLALINNSILLHTTHLNSGQDTAFFIPINYTNHVPQRLIMSNYIEPKIGLPLVESRVEDYLSSEDISENPKLVALALQAAELLIAFYQPELLREVS